MTTLPTGLDPGVHEPGPRFGALLAHAEAALDAGHVTIADAACRRAEAQVGDEPAVAELRSQLAAAMRARIDAAQPPRPVLGMPNDPDPDLQAWEHPALRPLRLIRGRRWFIAWLLTSLAAYFDDRVGRFVWVPVWLWLAVCVYSWVAFTVVRSRTSKGAGHADT